MKKAKHTPQRGTPQPIVPKTGKAIKREPAGPVTTKANETSATKKADLSTLKPKALAKGWSLTDGEEMNRLHPDRFQIPSDLVRRNAEVGLHVKIALESRAVPGERFW
jgi:hypothetical protein